MTVYSEKGYLEANPQNAYNRNSMTSTENADGSITIQFGGCDGKVANCLPITKGWNYIIRYYSPAERDPGRHVEVSRSTASGLITCIGKS
jgi:hypothetical protein